MFKKVVSVSMSPNTQKKDVWLALSLLFQPWRWRKGKSAEKFEQVLAETVGVGSAVAFDSGRSALHIVLQALGIGEGDEVLVSGYTCGVVANAIIYCSAMPIYVDIEKETFNMDIDLIEEAITPRTKAIVVQHTFGVPAEMEPILEIAKKHNLKVVEDCAHALGSVHQGKQVGSFGDAAVFSTGRDKVVSSVHGGVAVTNDSGLAEKIRALQNSLSLPSYHRIFQQLFHPVAFSFILPLYRLVIGKVLLVLFQKLGLMSMVSIKCEKKSIRPAHHPQKMANAMAKMAIFQLERLDEFNDHRKELARLYFGKLRSVSGLGVSKYVEGSVYHMYTVLHERASELRAKMKANGIIVGMWWGKGLVPNDVDQSTAHYHVGECLVAEEVAKNAVNLPTNINTSKQDAEKIIDIIKNF